MRSTKTFNLLLALVIGLALAIPAAAQEKDRQSTQTTDATQDRDRRVSQSPTAQSTQPGTVSQDTQTELRTTRVEAGEKEKIEGYIVRRDPDGFILRDISGIDYTVALTNETKVEERKSNPFRSAKKYQITSLLRGLEVEVEGRGNDSGALVAEKIKFTQDDYSVARSIETRAAPIEGRLIGVEGRVDTAETRLTGAETRLTAAEQNAQRLSGQVEELNATTNALRTDVKAAQTTADAALSGASAINDRISLLDNFEESKNVAVNFKVNSAVLTPEAKATLDEIANQAKNEKGFVIQVSGFASAEGNEVHNRRLSQRRADAVVEYLAVNHDIPLRRIITPFGYGELKPVADNTTREGREQNRRVEVAILVNKAITTPATINRPAQRASNQQ